MPANPAHNPLESYLEEIRAQFKRLPPETQDAELQEIRQHLNALVESHIALGDTEEEAITAATQQFGNPRRVGRALRQAWNKQSKRPLRFVVWVTISVLLGFSHIFVIPQYLSHMQDFGARIPLPIQWFVATLSLICSSTGLFIAAVIICYFVVREKALKRT